MDLELGAVARIRSAPSKFLQGIGRSSRTAVDVVMRSQLLCQFGLIPAAANSDGVESHLPSLLNAEVAESADPLLPPCPPPEPRRCAAH